MSPRVVLEDHMHLKIALSLFKCAIPPNFQIRPDLPLRDIRTIRRMEHLGEVLSVIKFL